MRRDEGEAFRQQSEVVAERVVDEPAQPRRLTTVAQLVEWSYCPTPASTIRFRLRRLRVQIFRNTSRPMTRDPTGPPNHHGKRSDSSHAIRVYSNAQIEIRQ